MYLLSLEEWITTVLVKALGWTFTHSIWQALLALLAAYAIPALMKKAKPAARYNILLLTSLLFICAVIVTFIYQLRQNSSMEAEIANSSSLRKILYHSNNAVTPVILESKRILDVLQKYFNQYLHLFVTVWFIIFCIKWLRLSLSLNYVNRISRFESAPANHEWQSVLNGLKDKLGIRTQVKLLYSNIVKVPLVTGFIKPMILVPAGLLANMPIDTIESILLHELAHIRRRDYLVNILQSAVETIFFFNPFILKLSDLIREEREACCDVIAVDTTKNKISYVEALVAFGEYSTSAPMLAFAGSKNHLLQRVKRILYNQNKKPGFMEKSILFSSVIMLFVITAFTTINNEKKPPAPVVLQERSFVTDTIPDKIDQDEPVKAENRKRKKKVRESEQKLEMKQKELEEMQIQLENMQQQIENEMQLKNEHIQQELKERENQRNIHNGRIDELRTLRAEEIDKAMKSIDIEKINRELLAVTLSKNIEQSKMIAARAAAQVRMQQSMIDSVTRNLSMTIKAGYMNDDVEAILGFLESNNVADAKDIKTFTLNEDELIVNNKKQPSSLHQQLKEKYIGGKGDHIIYSNSGGSKSISIQRNDPD